MCKFIAIGFIAALALLSPGIKVCAEPPPAEPVLSSGTKTSTDAEILADSTQPIVPDQSAP